MNKHEQITLGVGIIVIVFLAWIGGFFAFITNSSAPLPKTNTQQIPALGIPQIQGNNISSDPKLQVIDAVVGTSTKVAKAGNHVYVNYIGRLQDGTIFDSSSVHGKPIDFVLGKGNVIKGWDLGIQGMKVGGQRRLVISPDYAYGTQDVKNSSGQVVIVANSTLVFDVELVSVK
jgi:FKBP-type peptidyl-prolyl cis-trans isomerase